MSAKSITGFVFLFIFLFLLILVHFVFIFIFFLAIIIVIANKIKQRKKSKSNTGNSDHLKDQKNLSADSISDVTSDDAENILDDDDLIENKSKLNAFSFKEEEESKTSNKSPTLMNSKTINNNTKTSQKSENPSLQTDSVALSDKPVKTPKKSFNRARWNFRSDQSIEQKKRKFLKAIDICEQNDIGSKAKIRRLRIKLEKWNVENERDIDALIPDYEYLLDLIEEFETEK